MCVLYGLGVGGDTVELQKTFGMSDTGNVTAKWAAPGRPDVTLPGSPAAGSPMPFGMLAGGQTIQQKPWFDINGGVRWVPADYTFADELKSRGVAPQPRTGAPAATPGVDRPPSVTAVGNPPPPVTAAAQTAPAQAPAQQATFTSPALSTVAAASVRRTPERAAARGGRYGASLSGSGRLVN